MSPNTLFVVGAGVLHWYAIQQAKAMGLSVIATDGSMYAPGLVIADVPIVCDVYNIERHRALARACAKEYHLVGVTCAGGDAAPTVSAIAEEAALPGIPREVAQRTWDKYEVRFALEKAALAQYQPRWQRLIETYTQDLEAWVSHRIGYPCVVKPLSQRASRGVTLVETRHEFADAISKACVYGNRYLIEERLTGSEHSAEIVLDATGDTCHFHCCDRFFDYDAGIPLELGHINGSRLSQTVLVGIKLLLVGAATALGVTIGSFKADVIVTKDGPKILECTARCSGGFDSQVSYPRSSGDNLLQRVIQVACGLPVTPQPSLRYDKYCAVAAIIPHKAGEVLDIPDLGYGEVLWMIRPGETVQPPQHCAQRAGFVVAEDTDYDNAWREARELAEAYAEVLAGETR